MVLSAPGSRKHAASSQGQWWAIKRSDVFSIFRFWNPGLVSHSTSKQLRQVRGVSRQTVSPILEPCF